MAYLTNCRHPGCIQPARGGLCPTHQAERERARPSRQARGYGAAHDKLRKQWAPKVATGRVKCARCNKPIKVGQSWDLGHSDDRTSYRGPEHRKCNRATMGRERPSNVNIFPRM